MFNHNMRPIKNECELDFNVHLDELSNTNYESDESDESEELENKTKYIWKIKTRKK